MAQVMSQKHQVAHLHNRLNLVVTTNKVVDKKQSEGTPKMERKDTQLWRQVTENSEEVIQASIQASLQVKQQQLDSGNITSKPRNNHLR